MRKWVSCLLLAGISLMLAACAAMNVPSVEPTSTPVEELPLPGATLPADPDAPVSNEPGSPEPNPAPPSYLPRPEDKNWTKSKVYIEGAEILTLESFPPQFMLHVAGNLPNPCHQLRIKVNPPDQEQRVAVEVYSVADPTKNCIDVIQPFDASIRLDAGLSAGRYSVLVNDSLIGEMQVP